MALVYQLSPSRLDTARAFTCTEKLWLTADRSRLVPDGSAEAAFLFCVPGRQIPMRDAVHYGLATMAGAVSPGPEVKAEVASVPPVNETTEAMPQEPAKRGRGRPRKL